MSVNLYHTVWHRPDYSRLILSLRRRKPINAGSPCPLLYIHGATFPSALAVDWGVNEGSSWLQHLADKGWDSWAMDFAGFGKSERYPEMAEPERNHLPLGRAWDCQSQIAAACEFIRAKSRSKQISIIAHSWGTLPALQFSSMHPEAVHSLVLFAPIWSHEATFSDLPDPAWRCIPLERQKARFREDSPAGPVFEPAEMDRWLQAYHATDRNAGQDETLCVKIPGGPTADLRDLAQKTVLFDPKTIQVPTFLIAGAEDRLSPKKDLEDLKNRLHPNATAITCYIPQAGHLAHLSRFRYALWGEVDHFLSLERK